MGGRATPVLFPPKLAKMDRSGGEGEGEGVGAGGCRGHGDDATQRLQSRHAR